MGRTPGVFDGEAVERALGAARIGSSVRTIATIAGVHFQTLYRWLQRSDDDEDPDTSPQLRAAYKDFAERYRKARAEGEVYLAAQAWKLAATDGKHALGMLTLREPETWGRRERHDVSVATSTGARLGIIVMLPQPGEGDATEDG